jgi:hypothetical protein
MGSEILRRARRDATPASTPEVEFALVLSRIIDSVKNDPEQLRDTVYELARRKLQEQLTQEGVEETAPLVNALEVAIQGVEKFSRNNDKKWALTRLPPHREISSAHGNAPRMDLVTFDQPVLPELPVLDAQVSEPASKSRDRTRTTGFTAPWRFITVLAIFLTVAFVIRQQGVTLESVRKTAHFLMAQPASITRSTPAAPPQAAPGVAESATAKPSPLVPTSYGIYAVSEDKLYELEPLPGRAPDIRIAVSPMITTPSRAVLPNGRLRFVVFRRDSASSAADHAEVRVIAKIVRATSFDKAGKPIVSAAEDNWVIRNISIPYRTAPSRDNPDMYEIHGADEDSALSPGRYALILKGQAYDFSVAGTVTDTKQCLEQLAAANGAFYSECQKP